MRPFVLAATTLLFAAMTSPAWAQSADSRRAEALFDEGRALFDAGDLEAACAKFSASLHLEPAVGTRYHLAECLVRTDRLLGAAKELGEVARASRAAQRTDRARHAEERQRAVVELTPEIELRIDPQGAPVTVELDGVPIPRSAWQKPIPADPGRHIVRVWAPGRTAWSDEIELERRQKQLVQIPLLAPAEPTTGDVSPGATSSAPAASSPTDAPPDESDSAARSVFIGLTAGAGLAGVAVGSVAGIHALTTHQASLEQCRDDAPQRCTREGVELRGDARTAGTVSTVAFAIGVSSLAGAALLWLTDASEEDPSDVAVRLHFDRERAGFHLEGSF